jgi:hypothetical protein
MNFFLKKKKEKELWTPKKSIEDVMIFLSTLFWIYNTLLKD